MGLPPVLIHGFMGFYMIFQPSSELGYPKAMAMETSDRPSENIIGDRQGLRNPWPTSDVWLFQDPFRSSTYLPEILDVCICLPIINQLG